MTGDVITVNDAQVLITVHNSQHQIERSAPLLALSDASLGNLQLGANNLSHIPRGRMLLIGMILGALMANSVSLDTMLIVLGDEDRPGSRGTLPLDIGGDAA
jgi:hypothetical protein